MRHEFAIELHAKSRLNHSTRGALINPVLLSSANKVRQSGDKFEKYAARNIGFTVTQMRED